MKQAKHAIDSAEAQPFGQLRVTGGAFVLVLLSAFSVCSTSFAAQINLGVSTQVLSGPNYHGGGLTYDTVNGFADNTESGYVSYDAPSNRARGLLEFYINTTESTTAGLATNQLNVLDGLGQIHAVSSTGGYAVAGADGRIYDAITLNNSNAQDAAITVVYDIFGHIGVTGVPNAPTSRAGAEGGFDLQIGGLFVQYHRNTDDPSDNFDRVEPSGFDTNGRTYEFQPAASPNQGGTFFGHFTIPPGQTTLSLYYRLATSALGGDARADFQHTAKMQFQVPPGVTFTSESGTFLTGITAVSRKTIAAQNFDINLPLTGSAGIECRSGPVEGEYQVVVQFANPLSSMGSVTVSAPAGVKDSNISNGTDVVVNLQDVPNQQTTVVTLHDVHNGAINGDVVVPMSLLIADVDASGHVDAGDIGHIQQANSQATTDANRRADLDVSGHIDSGDIGLVQRENSKSLQQMTRQASVRKHKLSTVRRPRGNW